MGGRGASKGGGKAFDSSKYNINEKKWNKRERQNLDEALKFMEKHFGDISNETGEIKKKYLGKTTGGMFEYGSDSQYGKTPKQTLFNTDGFATSNTMVHEFTHAVADEMAHNYKKLGFKSYDDFYNSFRSDVYKKVGEQEPKHDGRKWSDRAVEFPAIHIENFFAISSMKGLQNEVSSATLSTLKQYWRKYKKG